MPMRDPELVELLERSLTPIAVLDLKGEYVLRSAGLEALTGYDNPEGWNVLQAMRRAASDPAVAGSLEEQWRAHLASGEPVEATAPFVHACGDRRWVRLQLTVHGEYRLLSAVDVTELVDVQAALRESEAQQRTLVENLPVGVYSLSEPMSGRISSANPAILEILGFDDPSEVIGSSSAILYEDPEDRIRLVRRLLDNDFQRSHTISFEVPLRRKDGSPILARFTVHGTFDQDNTIQRIDGVLEDITEQRAQQQALELSEQRFRGFFESSPLGMAIVVA